MLIDQLLAGIFEAINSEVALIFFDTDWLHPQQQRKL